MLFEEVEGLGFNFIALIICTKMIVSEPVLPIKSSPSLMMDSNLSSSSGGSILKEESMAEFVMEDKSVLSYPGLQYVQVKARVWPAVSPV